jgi:hypothetical protein
MNQSFKRRWLEESDYPELCKWWKAFRFPAPAQHLLPDNGRCGIMISKDGVNICAGFLYFTNSSFALCEYVVSNFEYKNEDRHDALAVLYSSIEKQAKKEGYSVLFSTVNHPSLINKMESFGWKKGSATQEMVKVIS